MKWVKESPGRWDATKLAIIGGAPEGALDIDDYKDGDLLPGEWWHVERNGKIVGYGWIDQTWGEAEILLVVCPDQQGKGIGTFILDNLEREAAAHGNTYLYNVVLPTHPDRENVTRWLIARHFEASHDDERLIRRVRPPV